MCLPLFALHVRSTNWWLLYVHSSSGERGGKLKHIQINFVRTSTYIRAGGLLGCGWVVVGNIMVEENPIY